MPERRSAKRYEISFPVAGWGADSTRFEGMVRDFSASGVYILTRRQLKPNERFLLLTSLRGPAYDDSQSLLWAHCRVVRLENDSVRGDGLGIAAAIEDCIMAEPRAAWTPAATAALALFC